MPPRFCTNCGAPLQPQNKFCKVCGTPVPVTKEPDSPVLRPPTLEDMGQTTERTVAVTETHQNRQTNHEQVPVTPETPAVKVKPAYRRGVGTIILAFMVCILVFVWSFGTIALTDTQISLSNDKIDNTLGSVLNTSQLMSVPAYYFFPDVSDPSQTLMEWSVEEIKTNSKSPITITTEMVEEFLEESTLLPFVIDKLGAYVADIRDNTGKSGVSADEIEDLVAKNEKLLHELSGDRYIIDNANIAEMLEEEEWLEYLDAKTLKDASPTAYNLINLGLSYWAIGALCLLGFLLLLVLFLCNRWNFWHTCGDFGTVLIIQSSILLIATGIALWLPQIWVLICGNIGLVAIVTTAILQNCFMFHAILLGTGILLGIMKLVWKKVCQHKAKR